MALQFAASLLFFTFVVPWDTFVTTALKSSTPCSAISIIFHVCPLGYYRETECHGCTLCRTIGDACESNAACCGGEALLCSNFSSGLSPQCLCPYNHQWDGDGMRCTIPSSVPQQLILNIAYSILAILITTAIIATLVHVLRSQLGICERRKEHRTLEMDLEEREIDAVLEQPRPPPYSPRQDPLSSSATCVATATVNAGFRLVLPLTTLQPASPNEPPPEYEEYASQDARLLGTQTLQPVVVDIHYDEEQHNSSENNSLSLPDIVVTPPPPEKLEEEYSPETTHSNMSSGIGGRQNESYIHDNECCSDSRCIDDSITKTKSSVSVINIATCNRESTEENTIEDKVTIDSNPNRDEYSCSSSKKRNVSESFSKKARLMEEIGESSGVMTLPSRVKFDFNRYLSFQQSKEESFRHIGNFTSPACDAA